MGTVADKLNYLQDTKEAIKSALIEKGVSVADSDTFRSYAGKIASIEGGGGNSDMEDAIITRTITAYTNERVTSIGNQALMQSASLESVSFPNAKTAGLSAFNNCTSLVDVNLPSLQSMNIQTFYGCNSLEYLKLPSLKSVATQSIRNCKKIAVVDLPVCTSIGNLAFDSDSALKCIILRSSTMCTLASSAALNGTLIASGTGYVYVPRNLIASYQAATQWSTYPNQFRALEDYTIDGTTSGDIDMTKI